MNENDPGKIAADRTPEPPPQENNSDAAPHPKETRQQSVHRLVGAHPKLNLGGRTLPAGIAEEDIAWRLQAGLPLETAIEAELAQRRQDEEEAR